VFWNITADELYDMLLPLLGINPAEAEYYWQLPKIYTTGEHKFVIRDSATSKTIKSITVTVFKVDIVDEAGNPITRELTRSVGQKITLKAKIEPDGLTGLTYLWAIPGTAIENYCSGSLARSATIDQLTDAERTRDAIAFYWVDGSNHRVVSVAVCDSASDSVQFKVEAPTLFDQEVVPCDGANIDGKKEPDGTWFRCGTAPALGLKWTHDVKTSPSFAGTFRDTQLVQMETQVTLAAVPTITASKKTTPEGEWWLDGGEAYGPERRVDTPDAELGFGSNDSPGERCLPSWNKTHVKKFCLTTYLMFKPDVADAIWVPLQKCTWGWTGILMTTDDWDTWIKIDGGHNVASPRFSPETVHPTWSKRYGMDALEYVEEHRED
jgi:hypothetical protein